MATAARKTTPKITDQAEIVERTPEEMAAEETTTPKTADQDETMDITVTLANGTELVLEVIRDQEDWAYEAVEAMAEMNYPVLVNAILTRGSKFKLKAAGAKVRDFEMITEKVSEALGVISSEKDDA